MFRNKKENGIYIFFISITWLLLFLFYSRIRPIMIWNIDDWTYISYIRNAFPIWKEWNPTKIFPETIEGLLGYFAAFAIYPVTGKYGYSITYTFAFFLTVVIIVYVVLFSRFVKELFNLTCYKTIAVTIFFISCHFLVLKSQPANNKYLLTAINANCIMNYLVPTLFCASIAFGIIEYVFVFSRKKQYNYAQKGLLLFLVYMAIYSNMASNIVLLAPIIYLFFADTLTILKDRGSIIKKEVLRVYSPYLFVIILELVCLIYESQGGRADSLIFSPAESSKEMIQNLKIIIRYDINKKFFLLMLLILMMSGILFIKRRRLHAQEEKQYFGVVKILVWSFLLCSIYTVLLFIRVRADKILRCENITTMFLYFVIIASISLAYLIKIIDRMDIFLPVMSYMLFVAICVGGPHAYKQNGIYDTSMEKNEFIISQIIEQFKEADMNNQTSVELHYPEQLPLSQEFAQRIANTLYNHGIVQRILPVQVVPDSSLNVW